MSSKRHANGFDTWLAVINPRSGHRKNRRHIAEISGLLGELSPGNIEIYVTSHIGDAIRVARSRRDVGGFIAVGGDGTIFDIINGMDLHRQVLAVFPAGTGNGLARETGIASAADALASIRGGRQRRVDLVEVRAVFPSGEHRRWLVATTAAAGYAARVVELANVSLKPFGPLCYPLASLFEGVATPVCTGRMRIDGGRWNDFEATNVMVNNTAHAGDFKAFPGARCDDGLFDCLVARAGMFSQWLHNLSVLSRLHFYSTAEPFTATSLELEFDEQQLLMLDGELVPGVVALRFSIMKSALGLRVPAGRTEGP